MTNKEKTIKALAEIEKDVLNFRRHITNSELYITTSTMPPLLQNILEECPLCKIHLLPRNYDNECVGCPLNPGVKKIVSILGVGHPCSILAGNFRRAFIKKNPDVHWKYFYYEMGKELRKLKEYCETAPTESFTVKSEEPHPYVKLKNLLFQSVHYETE